MKIAIDCRMIGSGGIGSYLSALLPFFIENYECLLFGPKDKIEIFKNEKVELLYCDIPTFSFKELLSFPKEFSKIINQCDLYYSPYCNIPSGITIPIYTTIHDVVFLDIPGLAGKIGTFLRKCFYQHAINKSKTIFTVSNFSKDRIKHHLNDKNKKIIVTYNAVPNWFYKDVNKSIQKDDFILFVGNIKAHKGLHYLLEAFNKVLESGLNTKLKIVGNADNFRTQDNTIWNEIENLPKNAVEFTGRISDSELKTLYSSAKLLIQPSLYEGFGMPPMEALICGTNVVLSDIPVFTEIYKDFPVTFFKVQDSNDLAEKIISTYNKKSPESLPDIYSFEKTFNIIKKELAL